MTRTLTFLAAGLMVALALPMQAHGQQRGATAKKIYCWDEGGKRVCGDALPPEAAGAAREEISTRTGLTTRQVERALTAEERAALAEREAVQEVQQMTQAERARKARALVASYNSAEAVRQSYQERISLAQARLDSTRQGIEQTRPHIVRLLRTAGDIELAGNKVPPKQAEAIMKVRANMVAMQRQAQMQEREITQIEAERAEAVALYLEFSQADAGNPAGATAAEGAQ